eukprot:scaffold199025_cov18-Tisochrysis_lutea.AAC.1
MRRALVAPLRLAGWAWREAAHSHRARWGAVMSQRRLRARKLTRSSAIRNARNRCTAVVGPRLAPST